MLKEGIGDDIYHTHFRNLSDCRWWSPDPLESKFPDVSPYLSMGGNPIKFSDEKGDVVEVEGELPEGMQGPQTEFATNQRAHLNRLQETEKGKKVYDDLHNSQEVYTVVNEIPKSGHAEYKDKKILAGNINDQLTGSYLEFGHEIYHAYQAEKGILGRSIEREVEAYLFASYLADNIGFVILSNKLEMQINENENEKSFRSAFIELQTSDKFSSELFSKTSNLFKSGSPWNKGKLYEKYDVLGDKFIPTINELYPLK